MLDAHAFLRNLAPVLCVAALTTVVFHRLRQPVVFGYLLAGMIVGPHITLPAVADDSTVRALSEFGFEIRKLGMKAIEKNLYLGPKGVFYGDWTVRGRRTP